MYGGVDELVTRLFELRVAGTCAWNAGGIAAVGDRELVVALVS